MDKITFEEIVSILAMNGRPDLICEFKDNVKIDKDYKPPNFVRKEKYSDDEGSAESESDYSIEEDENGFQSLK
jgi:hypothetical protein